MSIKVAVLSSFGSDLIVPVLRQMERAGIQPTALILNGKMSDQAMEIATSRMDGWYQVEQLSDLDLPHLPTYFVLDHNSESTIQLVKSLEVDYLLNAGTPKILKDPILRATRGVINCHPGILPAYRGCTCVEWSIYNNDPVGASAHFMSEKIDEGPILLSRTMKVKKFEDYSLIRTRILFHQVEVLVDALKIAAQGKFSTSNPPPQKPLGEGQYHKPITPEKILEVRRKLSGGEYESL